ncbi:MAG: nucleotide sugar dehydrogenase [Synechococcales bacterium]|nr:nucleotide sugar dehydrogenase [Synechococcales bacterium]
MRILVWGLGYVGTVVSACFAKLGHEVIGVEINAEKVEKFNSGYSPIKEPGLDEIIQEGLERGNLKAVCDGRQYVTWADASLICVGTPSAPDGSPVLKYVHSVAQEIGYGLRGSRRYHVVVLRSTVFAGVARQQILPILERCSEGRAGENFGLAMNPEFLRETTAVKDFYEPPLTAIGELDQRSGDVVEALYQGIDAPVYRIGLEDAEVLKVVNNAFHALKVGFANEIGRLCDSIGVDSQTVMQLLCADTKLNISPKYLMPGFAFGGSCLPKDMRSLVFNARRLGEQLPIASAVLQSNQVHIDAARLKVHDLGVRSVAILGLSFKAGTDDLRESPVIELIRHLWRDGVRVVVHDPDVNLDTMLGSNREYLERQLPQAHKIFRASLLEALEESEAIVLSQKRPEFASALQVLDGQMPVLDLTCWKTTPAQVVQAIAPSVKAA